eukprot:CAMPEP_0115851464 /NCGR_PEP_ID=MMETSP0287-20121206/12496_1 /TAXON_ID=412157 /ORGANISM="Chrysochromulina rotalis, Strain UIO044" /LENGTH=110 /DNA_ID=CAMNT_0003305499 /DNA_START=234 /DNA_END=562 /DNA_ORIENTATION=-
MNSSVYAWTLQIWRAWRVHSRRETARAAVCPWGAQRFRLLTAKPFCSRCSTDRARAAAGRASQRAVTIGCSRHQRKRTMAGGLLARSAARRLGARAIGGGGGWLAGRSPA